MDIIQTIHLTKVYGEQENQVYACKDINLSIRQGEFTAIIGASGSGKSTLLHVIGGVDSITSGKVIVADTDISALTEADLAEYRRKKAAIVYQFFNLIPSLSVEKNILFPLLLKNEKPPLEFFHEVVTLLDLQDKLQRFPHELSGGQQQRAAIARSMLVQPAVVLADEPTGNLDKKNSQTVIALLKECSARYKQTVLLVTHDESIAKQAERVITLEDGSVISDVRR